MKLKALIPFALVCLAAPLAFAQPAGGGGGGGNRVAVANPGRIFREMRETQDLKESLEAEGMRLDAAQKERQGEVIKLQNQRNQLKTDTPQWDEQNAKLLDAAADFELWQRKAKLTAERQQKRQMKALFERVEQGIAEVAQRDGYDLVISDQRPKLPENLDAVSLEQFSGLINSRNVLFASSKLDISDAVIALLDAKYKGRGSSAAPAGTGTAAPAAATPAPAAGPRRAAPAPAAPRQGGNQ